ncbi:hypothetical protein EAG75_08595 [Pseudomonas protegens]|nr:hypothetical protein EAG75_08595 [Pseudomonas protegens]
MARCPVGSEAGGAKFYGCPALCFGPPLRSRRSRLAGEEARQPCIAAADAFAGKPAPTDRARPGRTGSGRVVRFR